MCFFNARRKICLEEKLWMLPAHRSRRQIKGKDVWETASIRPMNVAATNAIII